MLKNRRGVLDAGIIILGIIVAIVAIVAATLTWSDVLETSYVKLITEMPKFEYNIQEGRELGNRNFEIYQILRNIALLIFVFVIIFSGLSFMFENISLIPPETGYQILSKSIIYVFFFFFFPPLWDLLATAVEQTSLWILNPEDTTDPTKNISYLLNRLGNGIECNLEDERCKFSLDALVSGITDPFTTLKNMFLITFLAVFKAIAFLIFMFTTFLLGTIRIVLTATITIAIPIILVLSLLPFFRRITSRFIDAFLGLMITPIFSALGIIAGVAHLQTIVSSNPDPIVEWFTALAIMGLTTFIPVLVVPMLGSLFSSITSITSSAVSTGTKISSIGIISAMHGITESANILHRGRNWTTPGTSLVKSIMPEASFTTMIRSGMSQIDPSTDFERSGGQSLRSGKMLEALTIRNNTSVMNGVNSMKSTNILQPVKQIETKISRDHVLDQDLRLLESRYKDTVDAFTPPEIYVSALEHKTMYDTLPINERREMYTEITKNQISLDNWNSYSTIQKEQLVDYIMNIMEKDVVNGFQWLQNSFTKAHVTADNRI